MFYLLQKYPNITRAVINDINPHLIHTYQAIKHYPEELILKLTQIQSMYSKLNGVDAQKGYFLKIRERFNNGRRSLIEDAAYMIFLNRTCFNGLYRENSKGGFNVSFGKYVNPTILDENLIRTDCEILQKVDILQGDFSQIESYISDYTFIYFDPLTDRLVLQPPLLLTIRVTLMTENNVVSRNSFQRWQVQVVTCYLVTRMELLLILRIHIWTNSIRSLYYTEYLPRGQYPAPVINVAQFLSF